jgi:hypothetical protein
MSKRGDLNLPMIVITSLPGLGVLIEADRSPLDVAQQCLKEKRPVLPFIRHMVLGGRRPNEVLHVSTEGEQ